ncbi:Ribonuclease PH [Rickettsia prowazekii str. GvF12]|nr:Ribonuclease PH [Rickettsia prowazekii str. NMRC Madrid E]EOB10645.1 Ribonuclease PH [Rickettsia prowazekii str. GvF12]EOB10811.1 10 kDa chaperonin [Rickettsia prowazekii str. Cairo 3]
MIFHSILVMACISCKKLRLLKLPTMQNVLLDKLCRYDA